MKKTWRRHSRLLLLGILPGDLRTCQVILPQVRRILSDLVGVCIVRVNGSLSLKSMTRSWPVTLAGGAFPVSSRCVVVLRAGAVRLCVLLGRSTNFYGSYFIGEEYNRSWQG